MKHVKLCVIGPYQAGKTMIIKHLDPNALTVGYTKGSYSTTIGLDLGVVYWDVESGEIQSKSQFRGEAGSEVWEVYLFGTPGQMRYTPVRQVLVKGSSGLVLVIDSTKLGQVGFALAMYNEVRNVLKKNVPMVVMANKQDEDNAVKPDTIADLLGLPDVPVYGTSAITGVGIREALVDLLSRIRREEIRRISYSFFRR